MNVFKRMLALCLSALTIFSLVGCSASASDDGGVIELEYWHINSETFGGPVVTEIIAAFNEAHDNINVTEKFVPNTYQGIMQDLQAAAAAGSSPDLVQIGWSYKEYFSNNFSYLDAEELFAQYGDSTNATFVDDTYETSIKNLAINEAGDMVGFPYGLSVPVIYMNESILADAGVDMADLNTWEDVFAAATVIKGNTDKWGLYIAEYSYTWELQQILESNGASNWTDGVCTISSPEAVEAYQMYADAVLTDKSALHIAVEDGKQAFINGEIGLYMESVSYSTFLTTTPEFDVSVMAAPAWEGSAWKLPCGGNFIAVTSSTDAKREATVELIQWILAEENMLAWDAGTGYVPPIKGVEDSELMQSNVVTKMAYDCLGYAVPWTAFPGDNGLKAEEILITTRDQILGGTTTVEAGLQSAADKINALYQ